MILVSAPAEKKIQVIKVVRELTSLGLQGSEGLGRRCSEARQGRRDEGRIRDDEEEA